MKLSLVIPVMNEEENITPMLKSIENALSNINYEIIFVDDGSSDETKAKILNHKKSNIRLIEFSRNYGQTSALSAGIEASVGEYIATLDGDLQNDPRDIPKMISQLESKNLDVVAGIRSKRNDGFIFRKIPSKIANWIIKFFTGVKITDTGCTLKVFRSKIAKDLDLYGELHRFIPVLASMKGAKISEIPVRHHARKFGVSKYGIGRVFKVTSDLLLLLFFQKYKQKPMHLFGTLGICSLGIGLTILLYLTSLKIIGEDIGHRPLFFIGILCIITSLQFITTGFIAELIMRTYYGASSRKPYIISKQFEGGKEITQKEKNV